MDTTTQVGQATLTTDHHGKTYYCQNRMYNYQCKTTGIALFRPFINQLTLRKILSSSKTFSSKLDRSSAFSLHCIVEAFKATQQ